MDTAASPSYPPVGPAAGAPAHGMMSIRHSAPPSFGDDDERTIARPVSSPPPGMVASRELRGRRAPSIAPPPPNPGLPPMLEEQERTAMMQVPAGIRSRSVTIQTPATVMAPAGAIPAELRAQVLAQMQASRATLPTQQGGNAMDQAIAAQLANVQRAQPIAPPAHLMQPPLSSSALHIDAPPTTLTARIPNAGSASKGPFARSTMTWAAALVSMGVFVGLVTAAVVRSDGQAQAAAEEARRTNAGLAAKMTAMGAQGAQTTQGSQVGTQQAIPQNDPSQVQQQVQQQVAPQQFGQGQGSQAMAAQLAQNPQFAQQMAQNPQLAQMAQQAQTAMQNGQMPQQTNPSVGTPQSNMTPAQLQALLGSQGDTPNNTVPAVVTNSDPVASADPPSRHASTSRHTSHLSTGSGPVATSTPSPTPHPASSHGRHSGPSDNDVKTAADALAKAQLEQSL